MDYRWKYEKMALAAAGVIKNAQELQDDKNLQNYLLFLFDRVFNNGFNEGVKEYRPPVIPVQDLSHIPEILAAVQKRRLPIN